MIKAVVDEGLRFGALKKNYEMIRSRAEVGNVRKKFRLFLGQNCCGDPEVQRLDLMIRLSSEIVLDLLLKGTSFHPQRLCGINIDLTVIYKDRFLRLAAKTIQRELINTRVRFDQLHVR